MSNVETSRMANSLANMADMMNRLGLANEGREQMTLAAAVRACEHCAADGVCRDWLHRAGATLSAAPAFCPNAARFAGLLAANRNRPV
jgi:Family of unknown function (DUF6455)